MKTRFRGLIILTAVIFAEGVITAFADGFPFATAAGIQAGLYATYVTGRSVTNAVYTNANSSKTQ